MARNRNRSPKGRKLLTDAIGSSDLSKTEFADSVGILLNQLRHIEVGRRIPTLPQAIALEDHLEIPIRAWL